MEEATAGTSVRKLMAAWWVSMLWCGISGATVNLYDNTFPNFIKSVMWKRIDFSVSWTECVREWERKSMPGCAEECAPDGYYLLKELMIWRAQFLSFSPGCKGEQSMLSVHLLNMGNTEQWLNRGKKTHSLYVKITIYFLSLDSSYNIPPSSARYRPKRVTSSFYHFSLCNSDCIITSNSRNNNDTASKGLFPMSTQGFIETSLRWKRFKHNVLNSVENKETVGLSNTSLIIKFSHPEQFQMGKFKASIFGSLCSWKPSFISWVFKDVCSFQKEGANSISKYK